MKTISLRKGREEVFATKDLYQEVFMEDTKEFIEYYYQEKSKNSIVYTLEGTNGVIAMLHLNPYVVFYTREKSRESISYIVAVATKENYRKKGYMQKLLIKAMEERKAQKQSFAFLMPANPAIYEPYGFSYIYARRNEILNKNAILKKEIEEILAGHREQIQFEIRNNNYQITAFTAETEELVSLCQEVLQKRYGLFCEHTKEYLLQRQKELKAQDGSIFLIRCKEKIVGYFFYTQEDSFLQEAETLEAHDRAMFFQEEKEPTPIIMARILDLQEMGKHIKSENQVQVVLTIKDDFLEENNGTFYWKIDKDGSAFTPCKDVDKKNTNLTVTIADLTAYVFGYQTLEKTFLNLTRESKRLLANIKGIQNPYLNEIV